MSVKFAYPKIHYYNQDFIDLYNQSWSEIQKNLRFLPGRTTSIKKTYLSQKTDRLFLKEVALQSFFLLYTESAHIQIPHLLDLFYKHQKTSGELPLALDFSNNKTLCSENITFNNTHWPLAAYVEYNVYNKLGSKKRVKEILPLLVKHQDYLEQEYFNSKIGLYHVPLDQANRQIRGNQVRYPIDFNAGMALNLLCLIQLGELINDKSMPFVYRKKYLALKMCINQKMWSTQGACYQDLDSKGKQLSQRTLAAYLCLLAQIPNSQQVQEMIKNLEKVFLRQGHLLFCADTPSKEDVHTYQWLFFLNKGLAKYEAVELNRELIFSHLASILMHRLKKERTYLLTDYYSIDPKKEWAQVVDNQSQPIEIFLLTITLMIESLLGIFINVSQKIVTWSSPMLEYMGLDNLNLRKNQISLLIHKKDHYWHVQVNSEKLYYFKIRLKEQPMKTLPIPAGRCSVILNKIFEIRSED